MPLRFPVGSTLFFPQFDMRLVRSTLPPHQAVFRVPPNLNKLDIRQILEKLYSVDVTDVRTMNYLAKTYRDRRGERRSGGAYKKVIVTMKNDFVFPDPPTEEGSGAMRLPPVIPIRAPIAKFRHLLPKPAPADKDGNS
ncbi:hypothetical protein HK101_012007 [Irineochytrium annulatum]|nr:hypothetical protein HK101_012007 [Irineochytrium annulatum]